MPLAFVRGGDGDLGLYVTCCTLKQMVMMPTFERRIETTNKMGHIEHMSIMHIFIFSQAGMYFNYTSYCID